MCHLTVKMTNTLLKTKRNSRWVDFCFSISIRSGSCSSVFSFKTTSIRTKFTHMHCASRPRRDGPPSQCMYWKGTALKSSSSSRYRGLVPRALCPKTPQKRRENVMHGIIARQRIGLNLAALVDQRRSHSQSCLRALFGSVPCYQKAHTTNASDKPFIAPSWPWPSCALSSSWWPRGRSPCPSSSPTSGTSSSSCR